MGRSSGWASCAATMRGDANVMHSMERIRKSFADGCMRSVLSVSGSLCKDLPRERDAVLDRGDRAVKLLLVDLPEHHADARPRRQAKRQQVPALDDGVGWCVLNTQVSRALEKPVHG